MGADATPCPWSNYPPAGSQRRMVDSHSAARLPNPLATTSLLTSSQPRSSCNNHAHLNSLPAHFSKMSKLSNPPTGSRKVSDTAGSTSTSRVARRKARDMDNKPAASSSNQNQPDDSDNPRPDPRIVRELSARMAALNLHRNDRRSSGPPVHSPAVRRNQIVHALARYNVLLGSHLLDLFYAGFTYESAVRLFQREIRTLLDAGWVEAERHRTRSDTIYWPGYWNRVLQAVNGRRRWGNRRLLWDHDLLTADFMTGVVVAARGQDGVADWWGEYESWLPPEVRPDAIGSVQIGSGRLDFLLEADTGSEVERVVAAKYEQYLSYYFEGNWRRAFSRESYPAVVVVTSGGEGRLHNMVGAVAERMAAAGVWLPWYFTTEARMVAAQDEPDSPGVLHQPLWFTATQDEPQTIWPL